MFLRDTCHRESYQRSCRDKRLLRGVCFDLGDVKVEKDSGTFNEEEDEESLVEEGPQIERCGGEDTLVEEVPQIASVTVFLRDTRHREIHQRNIRDKQFPRKAFALTRTMSKWRNTL